MSLHIYGTEGTRRTEVLAGSATDTPLCVHYGYLRRVGIIGIVRHHLYGTCRTMACAVAACHTVGQRQTVVLHPNSVTCLYGRLVRSGNS